MICLGKTDTAFDPETGEVLGDLRGPRPRQRRRRQPDMDAVIRLAVRALENGGIQKNPSTIEWNVAGRCEDPHLVEIWARQRRRRKRGSTLGRWSQTGRYPIIDLISESWGNRLNVDMWVSCRKCRACLLAKANAWANRAEAELSTWPRTWFATFTFGPGTRTECINRARLRLSRDGVDYDALSDAARRRELVREAQPYLTRYLKLLRKGETVVKWEQRKHKRTGKPLKPRKVRVRIPGARLRYLAVTELHADGTPHIHALIHEMAGQEPIVKRRLHKHWKAGFSYFKLVEIDPESIRDTAWYVCKYLTKSSESRVRASLDYGFGLLKTSVFDDSNGTTPVSLRETFDPPSLSASPPGEDQARPLGLAGVGKGTDLQNGGSNGRNVSDTSRRPGGSESVITRLSEWGAGLAAAIASDTFARSCWKGALEARWQSRSGAWDGDRSLGAWKSSLPAGLSCERPWDGRLVASSLRDQHGVSGSDILPRVNDLVPGRDVLHRSVDRGIRGDSLAATRHDKQHGYRRAEFDGELLRDGNVVSERSLHKNAERDQRELDPEHGGETCLAHANAVGID